MSRRGQMLVIVLWVIGLVGLAVGAVTMHSTHELRLGRMPLHQVQRLAVAEAAVQQALVVLQDDATPDEDHLAEPWATGLDGERPVLGDLPVGEGQFRVGVADQDGAFHLGLQDEERRLNVNSASLAALTALVAGVDAEATVAPEELAGAIVDWRSPGPGAWCGEDGATFCRNRPLQSVEELLLVPGMTPDVYEALEPFVTIYGHGMVNVNTASATVLDALGCPGESLVRQRQDATPPVLPPSACPGTVSYSQAYRVPVEAWIAGASPILRVAAVVHRDGRILAWSQDP